MRAFTHYHIQLNNDELAQLQTEFGKDDGFGWRAFINSMYPEEGLCGAEQKNRFRLGEGKQIRGFNDETNFYRDFDSAHRLGQNNFDDSHKHIWSTLDIVPQHAYGQMAKHAPHVAYIHQQKAAGHASHAAPVVDIPMAGEGVYDAEHAKRMQEKKERERPAAGVSSSVRPNVGGSSFVRANQPPPTTSPAQQEMAATAIRAKPSAPAATASAPAASVTFSEDKQSTEKVLPRRPATAGGAQPGRLRLQEMAKAQSMTGGFNSSVRGGMTLRDAFLNKGNYASYNVYNSAGNFAGTYRPSTAPSGLALMSPYLVANKGRGGGAQSLRLSLRNPLTGRMKLPVASQRGTLARSLSSFSLALFQIV